MKKQGSGQKRLFKNIKEVRPSNTPSSRVLIEFSNKTVWIKNSIGKTRKSRYLREVRLVNTSAEREERWLE